MRPDLALDALPPEWVAWLDTCRLLEPLGYLPPAECEMQVEQLVAAPRLLEYSTD
jgi:hypothetical protein